MAKLAPEQVADLDLTGIVNDILHRYQHSFINSFSESLPVITSLYWRERDLPGLIAGSSPVMLATFVVTAGCSRDKLAMIVGESEGDYRELPS